MIVKTIRDYKDRETKEIYRVKDKKNTREVTDERGAELIAKGVVVKVETATKPKNTNTPDAAETVETKETEETAQDNK